MKKYFSSIAIVAALFVSAFSADAASVSNSSSASSSYYEIISRDSSVSSHDTDTWTLTLNGQESYKILVDGDGDTDLDIYLYDENGNLIAKDIDSTDYCIVYVTPRWTGKFTLKIKNLGNVYNCYNLKVSKQ